MLAKKQKEEKYPKWYFDMDMVEKDFNYCEVIR